VISKQLKKTKANGHGQWAHGHRMVASRESIYKSKILNSTALCFGEGSVWTPIWELHLELEVAVSLPNSLKIQDLWVLLKTCSVKAWTFEVTMLETTEAVTTFQP